VTARRNPRTSAPPSADDVLQQLREAADPAFRADLTTRYGIPNDRALGVPMATMRAIARRAGTDHDRACALWATGWYEARIVAAFIDDPAQVTGQQMDAWADDFDSWAIVDTVCLHLFDRAEPAWSRVDAWAARDQEFVRRAALALLWALALHDRSASDDAFRQRLSLVEAAAHDPRHLVRKAAAMALRAITKKRPTLRPDVRTTAQRLAGTDRGPARSIGRRALREA
jgi:3-methyladenine DNA glycosylase AlkD